MNGLYIINPFTIYINNLEAQFYNGKWSTIRVESNKHIIDLAKKQLW